jgi:hypothetical protein
MTARDATFWWSEARYARKQNQQLRSENHRLQKALIRIEQLAADPGYIDVDDDGTCAYDVIEAIAHEALRGIEIQKRLYSLDGGE